MAKSKRNLTVANPSIAAEWHREKNGELTPADVTPGSGRKVWWQCEKGHEWQAVISDRAVKKSRCPYCVGKRATAERNLETKYPKIASEWLKTRNAQLSPRDLLPYSGKKVWWQCAKGHEWQAVVANRTIGNTGCPYCDGRKASETRNALTENPHLAKEWHPTKNGKLKLTDLPPSSNKKAWWICNRGHEWFVTVNGRAAGTGCPYCANKKVGADNSLAVLKPELAKEWDKKKNKTLTPDEVTPGSYKKAWWVCLRGHSWKAIIRDRSRGIGCPSCSPNTSKFEIRIFTELDYLFEDVAWQEKIEGKECDIYLPNLHLGIEVDGYYWHKDKEVADARKTEHFNDLGIQLIRVREPRLPALSDIDILVGKRESQKKVLQRLIARIAEMRPATRNMASSYIANDRFDNSTAYKEICSALPGPPPELSLQNLRSDLTKQWLTEKNKPLMPEHFSVGSKYKAWWHCEKGHEWEATILNRTVGQSGCPYCAGKLASAMNNLQSSNPQVAAQWHPEKNNELTPSDVTANSGRIVWWKCNQGHEWRAQIRNRKVSNGKCPVCRSLAFQHPELACEWHPTKNHRLTPSDVVAKSDKKVWWHCERGHDWSAAVRSRVSGKNCTICNSLKFKRPDLASEWHPTKNRRLTPSDVTVGSDRKVWWQCSEGHEWRAHAYNRSGAKASGCPTCARLRRANAAKKA